MKNTFKLVLLASVFAITSCGPSAEEIAAKEQAVADSIAAVEAKAQAVADSIAAAEAAQFKADSIAAARAQFIADSTAAAATKGKKK